LGVFQIHERDSRRGEDKRGGIGPYLGVNQKGLVSNGYFEAGGSLKEGILKIERRRVLSGISLRGTNRKGKEKRKGVRPLSGLKGKGKKA